MVVISNESYSPYWEAAVGTDDTTLHLDMGTYRFGRIAVYRTYASLEQIQRALVEQVEDDVMGRPHRRLGNILLEKNWITEEQMKSILKEMGVGE
jgi:hypothetical protein